MAKFLSFRILVALLATFGGFFAYVCRLNLSLLINEMTVQEISPLQQAAEAVATTAGQNEATTSEKSPVASLSGFCHRRQKSAAISMGQLEGVVLKESSQAVNKSLTRKRTADLTMLAEPNRKAATYSIAALTIDVRPVERLDEPRIEAGFIDRLLDPLPKLNWDKEARNRLLGAFFLGYVIFQVPAARAAEIFGAKTLILLSGFGTSFTTILFVLSARFFSDAVWCAYLVRVLMGAIQAGLYPAVYVLFCQWLPRTERSFWLPVLSAMGRVGTIVMNLFAPLIVRQTGWPMVFILSGTASLVWSLLFLVCASSSPATSRWLPTSELLYIQTRLKQDKQPPPQLQRQLDGQEASAVASNSSAPIDWLKVITNGPIGVLALVMFSADWTNMLLLVLLPSFLGPALCMELEAIGFWTICLVTVYCIGYPLSGGLASRLETSTHLSTLTIRKLFETTAQLLQAIGCLVVAVAGDKTLVLIALFIIMLGRTIMGGGQCLMPPELSGEYPGTVMAYSNAVSSLASFFGPAVVNLLVSEPTIRESWNPLWFLSAGLYFFCGLIFVLLADNSPQQLARSKAQDAPRNFLDQMQLTLPPTVLTLAEEDLRAPKKENVERNLQDRMTVFRGPTTVAMTTRRAQGDHAPKKKSVDLDRRDWRAVVRGPTSEPSVSSDPIGPSGGRK